MDTPAPADLIEIGRRAGRRVCPRGPWSEDVIGAAILGAWLHPNHARQAARWAAIDELARLTHHGQAGRVVAEVVSLDASGADRPTEDDYDLGPTVPLTATQRRVVALLGLGYSKADTARILGVTTEAISHTTARLRRTMRGLRDGNEAA